MLLEHALPGLSTAMTCNFLNYVLICIYNELIKKKNMISVPTGNKWNILFQSIVHQSWGILVH